MVGGPRTHVVLTNAGTHFLPLDRAWIYEIEIQLAGLDELHVDIGGVELLLAHLLVVKALRVGLAVVYSQDLAA